MLAATLADRRRDVFARVRRFREERARSEAAALERAARYRAAGHPVEFWLGRLLVFGDLIDDGARSDGAGIRTFASEGTALRVQNGLGERAAVGNGDLVPVLLDHRPEVMLGFARVERDGHGLRVRLDLAEPVPSGWSGISGGFAEWTTQPVAERSEDGRAVEVRRLVAATIAEVSVVREPGFAQSRLLRRVLGPRARHLVRALSGGRA